MDILLWVKESLYYNFRYVLGYIFLDIYFCLWSLGVITDAWNLIQFYVEDFNLDVIAKERFWGVES